MAIERLQKILARAGVASRRAAEQMIKSVQPILARYPTGFAQWLNTLAFALSKPKEIAIIGEPGQGDVNEMLEVMRSAYRPFQVTAVGGEDSGVPLLAGRTQLGGKATAYVCENFTCKQPVNEVGKLRELL